MGSRSLAITPKKLGATYSGLQTRCDFQARFRTRSLTSANKVVPQFVNAMVYGRCIELLTMVHKPTYITGGHHLEAFCKRVTMSLVEV